MIKVKEPPMESINMVLSKQKHREMYAGEYTPDSKMSVDEIINKRKELLKEPTFVINETTLRDNINEKAKYDIMMKEEEDSPNWNQRFIDSDKKRNIVTGSLGDILKGFKGGVNL